MGAKCCKWEPNAANNNAITTAANSAPSGGLERKGGDIQHHGRRDTYIYIYKYTHTHIYIYTLCAHIWYSISDGFWLFETSATQREDAVSIFFRFLALKAF